MTTKSDIDRMLETLESFRDSVPAHVRQLLRMLAARCDEVEERLAAIEPGIPKWVLDACSDETKHLLASPNNAERLEESIKQDKREDEGSFW